MNIIERRLRKIESDMASTETLRVVGRTQAAIDRKIAQLREEGFRGEIEPLLIQHLIVSPPPYDQAGNIIGEAPPPYIYEETEEYLAQEAQLEAINNGCQTNT